MASTERTVFPDGAPPRTIEHEAFKPPRITDATAAVVTEAIGQLETCLAAGDKSLIQARVRTLLEHYWQPREITPKAEQWVAHDWWQALKGYPIWAVMTACEDWRDGEGRRPTPKDLRERCQAKIDDHQRLHRKMRLTLERWRAEKAAGDQVPQDRKNRDAYCRVWEAKQQDLRQAVGPKDYGAFLKGLVPVAPATDPNDGPYQLGAPTAFWARWVAKHHGEILARILGRPVTVVVYNFAQIEHAKRRARLQASQAQGETRAPPDDR